MSDTVTRKQPHTLSLHVYRDYTHSLCMHTCISTHHKTSHCSFVFPLLFPFFSPPPPPPYLALSRNQYLCVFAYLQIVYTHVHVCGGMVWLREADRVLLSKDTEFFGTVSQKRLDNDEGRLIAGTSRSFSFPLSYTLTHVRTHTFTPNCEV